jgi:hypothetical protein
VSAFLADPVKWYHQYAVKAWARDEPTEAMQFGTNVHLMCAAGGPSALPIVGRPAEADFRKKEWKEWKAEQEASGVEIVDSLSMYRTIWQNLLSSDWIREVMRNTAKEVEHVWNDEVLGPCRCKFDAVSDGLIVDWKTTDKKNERGFVYSLLDFHYDVRLALYSRGYRDRFGVPARIVLVAIQKSGGFGVQPYELPDEWVDDAEARLILTVDKMSSFDIRRALNVKPVMLTQPKFSQISDEDFANV